MHPPTLLLLAAGLLLGLVAVAGLAFLLLPRLLLPERPSRFGLDETVTRLTDAARAAGWVVQSVIELEKSIEKHGGGTVRPVRLVNLCQAKHAARIMNDDLARRVSVLMPCTVSVYEKSDGSVWVGAMNPGLIAPFFGGVIAEVMGGAVAAEQDRLLASVRQD
ncbi:MAG: DUF302 domain-containing protein [Verrucomicrobiota bacterium]